MQWITALTDWRQVLHCNFYYFSTTIFTTFPLQFLLLFYYIFSRKNVVDQPGIEPVTFSMDISRSTNWSMKTWLRIQVLEAQRVCIFRFLSGRGLRVYNEPPAFSENTAYLGHSLLAYQNLTHLCNALTAGTERMKIRMSIYRYKNDYNKSNFFKNSADQFNRLINSMQ